MNRVAMKYPTYTVCFFLIFIISSCNNTEPKSITIDAPGPTAVKPKAKPIVEEPLSFDSADTSKINAFYEIGEEVSERDLVEGNNALAMNLFKNIRSKGENLIFSPYSIRMILAMVYAGAEGETAREMQEKLYFPEENTQAFHKGVAALNQKIKNRTQHSVTLNLANKLWHPTNVTMKDGFLEVAKSFHKAPVGRYKEMSEGIQQINEWASEQTNGKIEEIVTEENLLDVKLVLTNAIYFYGNWNSQFDKEHTHEDLFYTKDKTVSIPFMHNVVSGKIGKFDAFTVFELFYKNETASMLIVLPEEDKTMEDALAELSKEENRLWYENLESMSLNLSLPKWKLTSSKMPFAETFIHKMGLKTPFNEGKKDPNFSKMGENLYLGEIVQKAFISVSEEGSEAAAVSAGGVMGRGVNMQEMANINRPFIYLIKENSTNSILFMGQICDFPKN